MLLQRGRELLGGLVILFAGLSVWAEAPGTEAKPAVDQYGDPLPGGALARLGTVRWRHGSQVSFVGFTQGGKQVISASQDGTFRLWDAATGKEVRRFGAPAAPTLNNGMVNNPFILMNNNGNGPRVALSADGKIFASASFDGVLRLWEVATGKELRQLRSNQARGTSALVFAPDGKTIIAKSQTNALQQWDVETGKEVRTFGVQPGGRQVYWNSGPNSVNISPDGKIVASGNMELENNNWNSVVKLWDMATGKEIRQVKGAQNGVPSGIYFSKDSKTMFWVSGEGTIHTTEVDTGKEIRQIGGPAKGGYVSSLIVSPDGKEMASKSYNEDTIRIWETGTGKELRTLGAQPNMGAGAVMFFGGNGVTQTLAFSPDGKTLAEGGNNNSIRLWDMTGGKQLGQSGGHQGMVSALAMSADGKTLTSWATDNTVRQWEMATGKESRRINLPQGAMLAALSPDAKLLAFASNVNTVSIWDVAAGKELRQLRIKDQQFAPWGTSTNSLAFSPNSKLLAARGWDQSVHVWEATTGREVQSFTNPTGAAAIMMGGFYNMAMANIAFTPDGTTVVTVGPTAQMNNGQFVGGRNTNNSVITLYSITAGKQMRQFAEQPRGIAALAVSPDGRNLATANTDSTISILELATGKERFQIKGSAGCLAFSSDSRTLLGSGADQVIHLWDIRTGRDLGQLKGHQGSVLIVAFTPDDKRLVSASADTSLLIWDRASLKEEAEAPRVEAKSLDTLWTELASDDSHIAYGAMWGLVAAGKDAISALGERLHPVPPIENKRIEQLIANLDHNAFAVREKATEELEKLGPLATPSLKKLMEHETTFETRKRVERVLDQLATGQAPPPETLRTLRAVEVLEQIGTPQAQQVLAMLTRGAAGARLTEDAKLSLERLTRRDVK